LLDINVFIVFTNKAFISSFHERKKNKKYLKLFYLWILINFYHHCYINYLSTNVLLSELSLLQTIPFVNHEQLSEFLIRKWQKNLDKQGATGAVGPIENRGNTNPSSVGV
jgi:hypothetical protein